MTSNRIEYYDYIKGFAIILVVIGHIIDKSLLIESSFLNRIIYSIHMPIFMYVSGYFAFNSILKSINKHSFLLFFYGKVSRLLFPYFTLGIIYALTKSFSIHDIMNNISGYWFFPVLFMCMLITYIYVNICRCVYKRENFYIDLALFLLLYIILIMIYLLKPFIEIPYFLSMIKMYPFFIFGFLSSKYKKLSSILDTEYIYLFAFVIFIILLIWPINIGLKVEGIFSIIVIRQIFKKYYDKMPNSLSFIGKNTSEIYSLHWFILPNLLCIKNILYHNNLIDNNIIVVLFLSLFVSLCVTLICILLSYLIKSNKYLSFIIFGEKVI